jgi:hypothetical protein
MFITEDSFQKDSAIYTIIAVISIVGIYDIIDEILEDNNTYFSHNFTKKILIFSAIYLKTKSIRIASLLSIIIILLFPKVFSGPLTSTRKKLRLP